VISESKLDPPVGRRWLNESGQHAVSITADRIADTVDKLLGKQWDRRLGDVIQLEVIDADQAVKNSVPEVATCACGSGIPIQNMVIAGKEVTIVGLPLIFQQFTEAAKFPNEENISELMDMVKIYNPISVEDEPVYRDGIRKAYKNYWFKEKDK
jgi:hypothetical protein